jgi:YfiH family protein
MDFIFPDWTDIPNNIGALTTTRRGGVSCAPYDDGTGKGGLNLGLHVSDDAKSVRKNRELLRTALPAEPSWLTQVHGTDVVDAAVIQSAIEADASVTTMPGVVCAIQTADCLPVLFCDSAGKVVGAAHAGWRGLLHGVLENTIERMQTAGAQEIFAWMGPAIGPQSFEVGAEVMHAFCERDAQTAVCFTQQGSSQEKYLADIYQLARHAMHKAGVSKISGGGFCTVTERDKFYSYRRDKITGRMASLIWLK